MLEILFKAFQLKGGNSPLFFMRSNILKETGQISPANVIFIFVITILSFVISFNIPKYSSVLVISILAAVIVGMITLVSTNFALVILIFSMLLSPEIGGKTAAAVERGVTLRIEDFLIIAVFFVWLAKTTFNQELGLFRRTPLNTPILFYIGANVVCTALGVGMGDVTANMGFFYVLKFVEYFMIYFLFANNLRDMRQLKVFLFCFLLTSFIIGVYTYSQIGKVDRPTAPFEGAHAEPNTLGGYLMLCLAIVLGVFLNINFSVAKSALAGLFCFNIYPLLMTLSRGSYVGFVVSYLCFILFSKKGRSILIIVLTFSILFLPFITPKRTIDRVAYTFSGQKVVGQGLGFRIKVDASAASRFEIWSYVFDVLKNRPFLGYGVTGVGLIDSQYARTLAELGLIGFLSLIWLIFAILKNSWQVYKTLEDEYSQGLTLGFLCGFVGLLIMGFSANVFVIVRISEPFWFLAACVMVLPEIQDLPQIEKQIQQVKSY